MIITMLGTGNAFAKKYFNNNALIEYNQSRFLIDCGFTLPRALHEQKLTFNDLDGVIISHIHSDHIGGLETYAFEMKYQYHRKPKMYIASDLITPLWETSLKGGLAQLPNDTLETFFDIIPLEANQPYEITKGLSITLIPTAHIPGKKSFSILFNNGFFYSADMVFNEQLLLQLEQKGVHTFYHDCQVESPGVVHASLNELLTLPSGLQQKIKLMHYSDTIEQYLDKTGLMSIVPQGVPFKIEL